MDELSKNREACAEAVRMENELRHSGVIKCLDPKPEYDPAELAEKLYTEHSKVKGGFDGFWRKVTRDFMVQSNGRLGGAIVALTPDEFTHAILASIHGDNALVLLEAVEEERVRGNVAMLACVHAVADRVADDAFWIDMEKGFACRDTAPANAPHPAARAMIDPARAVCDPSEVADLLDVIQALRTPKSND